MFAYKVALQGAGFEDAVIDALEIGAGTAPYNRVRGAYAYATAGGAVLLVDRLQRAIGGWEVAEKRWLVSLDWGHTEPEALDFLASLPGSQVRIPNAAQVLAAGLVPRTCFHAKTLLLDQSQKADKPPATLAIGSANMTVSGLRFGYEHVSVATWLPGALSRAARTELAAMQAQAGRIESLWRRSRKVDRKLVNEYRALRVRVRARPRRGSDRPEDSSFRVRELERTLHFDFERLAELRTANSLWVEVRYVVPNRGAGVPGNQVDLAAGTRAFFGLDPTRRPRNTPLGTLRIEYAGRESARNMRFGNNSMDKLDLPIPGVDGPPSYDGEVLRFDRLGGDRFRLVVGTAAQAARWKAASTAAGTSYRMNGGREWGVLS